jgi:hypothetical protein
MTSSINVDYELNEIERDGLEKALACREYNRILNERLKDLDTEAVVVIESPAENYLQANVSSVKSMLDNGFEGVYLSFQRPFKNISYLFEKEGIELGRLFIIDFATVFSNSDQEFNQRCVNVSPGVTVEEMINTICSSLEKLSQDKRFVFVDSLSTLALHEEFSETMKFPERLINTIRGRNINDVTFVFNIADDLARQRYMKNVDVYANEHIHLGLCA